ncbi:MAG: hypothetical protein CL489_06600 [Acidobacteria bacterium]|nr:hypothetical protein [Acidobacteriota bacterium]
MPSVSPKQRNMMAALSHGWKPTKDKKKLPSSKVALDFHVADYPSHGKKKSADGPVDLAWSILKSR